jgi:type 1 glutamine amidotransferase
VGVRNFTTTAKLYKNPNLAPDATVLLRAKNASANVEPVAWVREPKEGKHGRVFYTSLGDPKDFANPTFQQLLVNAVAWTSGKTTAKKG